MATGKLFHRRNQAQLSLSASRGRACYGQALGQALSHTRCPTEAIRTLMLQLQGTWAETEAPASHPAMDRNWEARIQTPISFPVSLPPRHTISSEPQFPPPHPKHCQG